MAYVDVALVEKVFDIAKRESKPNIRQNGDMDGFGQVLKWQNRFSAIF